MEVRAKLSYLRMAPKKVRVVIDVVRGVTANQAIAQLNLINRAAAQPVLKLLNSAIANAAHNLGLVKDNLYIKKITANDGPTLKRWTPRAHGRATPIRKRTTHLEIVLDEITPSKKKIGKKKIGKEKVQAVKEKSGDLPTEEIKLKDQRMSEENLAEKGHEIHDVRLEGKHRHNQNADKREMKGKKGFVNKIFNRRLGS